MRTDQLDYDLPADRIATEPADPRDSARLMAVHRDADRIEHLRVRDLAQRDDLIRGGPTPDLLVFNESRVVKARFDAVRAATGGGVSGLYVQSTPRGEWLVLLESRGTLRPGERIRLADDAHLTLIERLGGGQWRAALESPLSTFDLLERVGSTPLPPYIRQRRKALGLPEISAQDAQRYNTIYAHDPGSVAAPTAGLHFTPELLDALSLRGVRTARVTLHVGLGTFAPVRTETLEGHPIHAEAMTVPAGTLAALRDARARGERVVPVGTTTVRALESLPDPLPAETFETSTRLFITPGAHVFRFADALLTNFHLPRSTLLALVAALPGVGIDRLLGWYRVAIAEGYRFYSYGDAMLIL